MFNTLFVVDDEALLPELTTGVISFESYLKDYPKLNETKIRVINLCDTSRYLSQGYYCSLLAEARSHSVLPTVKVINELKGDDTVIWIEDSSVRKKLSEGLSDSFVICMGEVANGAYQKLANLIYRDYMAPLLVARFTLEPKGIRVELKRTSLPNLSAQDNEFCQRTLLAYAEKKWKTANDVKKYRWDMAILVNPDEALPPSDRGAITRFIKAGEKLGMRTKTITPNEFNSLGNFDALFIRETTGLDHHTYRFSRSAEQQGLVVMDDPNAILRCCNKVFLQDAFSYQKVPAIPSHIISDISDETVVMLEESFEYPIVLKLPESAFSAGVFKAKNREELIQITSDMLKDSALVLAQKYLFTEYDWRIGVLNGRALFACRYYMAKNHWQIYNHGKSKGRSFSGGFDALPTFEVPSAVLNAALKAAAVVGDGLYGVDIKEIHGRAYVVEINDNPSIDHGVEDAYLGDELYMQVMSEFLRRLELRGK